MRIFGFNISVYLIKSFLLCGMILSCLFYFSSSIINFHVCVLGIFILLALGLSAVSLWLLKRSLNRKKMGKLRFLYDLSSVCINLLLLDEYVRLAFGFSGSSDNIECFAKASAAIIIGAIFLGISYLMTHREVMKKVWN